MTNEGNGVCPHCEAYTGPVGTPCIRAECAARNYLCIPVRWYDAAKAYSARKNKPIDPLVGRMIERYLLAANIGEGGMGSVYVAIQKPLFREVALKLIGDLDLNRHSVGRFEREARAISALDHPNIVKIHDYGVGELDRKIPYMALEYLRHGRTLRKAFAQIEAPAKVDGALVLEIFRQVLNALGAAHAVGIVHRDVKPENVMIVPVHGNPNLVKVLDFGLARMDSDETSFEGDSQAQGRLAGTPFYMAPEQIPRKGASGDIDGRADLYAVGVMLYEVLTGARPFEGDSPLAVLARKLDPSFDPMALPAAKGLAKGMRSFLAKALAQKPEDRHATASAMLEALEQVLETRASAVGLVVLGTESSSDRIEAPPADGNPESSPSLLPLADPSAATPAPKAGSSSPPFATPVSPVDRTPLPSPASPLVSGPVPGMKPVGLELDMPSRSQLPPLPPLPPLPEPPRRGTGPVHPPLPPLPPSPAPEPRAPAGDHRPKAAPGLPRPTAGKARPVARQPARTPRSVFVAIATAVAALALAPWMVRQVRIATAEQDMGTMRARLVRGGRFVGFEDGILRPTEGTDYVVLGATGAPDASDPRNDPWDNPYRVRYQLDKQVYVLRSMGPDGVDGPCRGDDPDADDLCLLLAGR